MTLPPISRSRLDTRSSIDSIVAARMLFFISEYLTEIGPELYMKQTQLSNSPVQFRKYGFKADNNPATSIVNNP